MRAYDPNSATPNTPVWTSSEVYHSASNNVVTMSFADLNRDGIPEVMIAGKIFNSTNGQLLCKTAIEFTSATYFISIPLADDIFRDGNCTL